MDVTQMEEEHRKLDSLVGHADVEFGRVLRRDVDVDRGTILWLITRSIQPHKKRSRGAYLDLGSGWLDAPRRIHYPNRAIRCDGEDRATIYAVCSQLVHRCFEIHKNLANTLCSDLLFPALIFAKVDDDIVIYQPVRRCRKARAKNVPARSCNMSIIIETFTSVESLGIVSKSFSMVG